MVFGMNDRQIRILAYLYDLKDTPQSPPDPRLLIASIAKYLEMTQREVRHEIKGLMKRLYIKHSTFEGQGYCKIMPRGIMEMEKHGVKTTKWEISTDRVGVEGSREETT